MAMSLLPRFCKGAEVDVRVTSDGVPILMHDSTVDRTTDGTGDVDQMTLAEIQALDAGTWYHSDFAGVRVPTLEAYLAAAKQAGLGLVLLDLYVPSEVAAIKEAIENTHMQDRVVVGCQTNEDVRTWRAVDWDMRLAIFATTAANIDSRIATAQQYDVDILIFEAGDSGYSNNKSVLPQIKEAGFLTMASAVNNSAMIRTALGSEGLDIVMSDDVGKLTDLAEVRFVA